MKFKVVLFMILTAFAAQAQDVFKGEHFIEVTGTAQTEIEPNEIYVTVRLREFEESKQKISLEKLDKDFYDALKEANIDRKRLELADAGSKLDKLGKKEKDAFREKTYQIKLTSGTELEKFLEKLEPVKVDLVDVTRVSHSDLEKIKIDLKVKALQAAKAKAEMLMKSIGSDIGKPLMVRDWDIESVQPVMNMRANVTQQFDGLRGDEESSIGFKKIKLQARITAQFEIK